MPTSPETCTAVFSLYLIVTFAYVGGVGLGGAFAPLGERPFRLLWLGRVASAAGDALVPVALAFAVLGVRHSATALGGVLAAFTIARVAFTLVGGVVADRLPRRAVMLACDGARALVEAFTAGMLLSHSMTLPLFFVTAAIFGAASAFFGPASDGLVPKTVSPANLQTANALLATTRNGLSVFGPAVSGVLIVAVGTGWVFAIDSASFLVSIVFLVQLKVPTHMRAPQQHFLRDLRDGWHEVISRDWVRAPILGFAISNVCLASFIVLGPTIFLTHPHGARDWGVISTCGAIGAIIGSLGSVRYRPRRPLTACFLATTLMSLPMAALAGPLPMPAVAVSWLLGFGSAIFANTYWETTLQRRIPEMVYSRVRSYDILVSFVFMPVGMVAFGPIAHVFGNEPTLLVASGVTVATNLVVAFVPGVHAVTADDAPVTAPEPQVA
jgi:MFS family permease